MSNELATGIAILLAYLAGSFPPAYIVTRWRKGIDIREVGTRNLGAMNVFYKVGFWEGLLVLALDIGKGAAAVALARLIGAPPNGVLASGVAAVFGHAFPVFLKFHGGRGGATSIGVLAVLLPWGIPLYLGIFGLSLLFTHFPTLSYSIAFAGYFLAAWLIYRSVTLLTFSVILLLIPAIRYISRVKEMRTKGGSWGRVFKRKNLKDRF